VAQGFAPSQFPLQPYQQYAGQYVQYQQPGVAPVPPPNPGQPMAPKKRKKKKNVAPAQGPAMVNAAAVPQPMVHVTAHNVSQGMPSFSRGITFMWPDYVLN
jgi:hypothetical protein